MRLGRLVALLRTFRSGPSLETERRVDGNFDPDRGSVGPREFPDHRADGPEVFTLDPAGARLEVFRGGTLASLSHDLWIGSTANPFQWKMPSLI